ncbi:hypothetical protein [Phyllobacterium sp. UNC302MFCol5.2]|uniref:hypothetical protein n=1 Tax=Phyllobacterium sp. UNC302MFCol5.2 TaxID=1449065 RepID=UPI0012DCEAB9|nr:hypothetical protein [Phyllobacterium sp. UNC302MFCol5.2]
MSDLSGSEIKLLRYLIGQAFPNLNLFSIFLSDQEFLPLPATVVNPDLGYEEALQDYIVDTIIPEALMNKFLRILTTKKRIRAQIQSLMDPVDIDSNMWLRTYMQGEVAFKYCDDEGVFDYFAQYHPFTAELWAKVTELKAEQISQSKYFLAIVTPVDLENLEATDGTVFDHAFNDWLKSRSGPPEARKRFMLIYEKEEMGNWWNKWKDRYRAKYPAIDDEPIFLRELKNDPKDRASVRAELQAFLNLPDEPLSPKLSNVLLLGTPSTADTDPGTQAGDVALFQYLRRFNADRVQYWEDGWGDTMRMTVPQRDEFFRYPPIFTRSASERNTTVGGLKDKMIPLLMDALGYSNDDVVGIWRDSVSKFQRVYWRSAGEWWDSTEINPKTENAWKGSVEEIGAKLAKLAGFGDLCESKLRTRFENLPDSDPNRQLLSTNLQKLGQTVVKPGEYETVAVSLDSLEESVSRFNRAQLNIVAAHDQRTRPGDKQHTINHFEDWDTRIDRLVGQYFPDREPKIFRIAVLFQNFDKFDGLKFDEGLSVRRWNLLKVRRDNNKIDFNSSDMNHLIDAAKDMMHH